MLVFLPFLIIYVILSIVPVHNHGFFYYEGLLAQLAEQLPFKEKVTGSNPVQRTDRNFE